METSAVILKIGGEHLAQTLQKARKELEGAEGELILDFSAVRQLDASSMKTLEELADAAEHKGLKLVLSGVNVETYKVLKLVTLAQRFVFIT